MAKVITLSQTFLSGHPKAGAKTHFVEQFFNSISESQLKNYNSVCQMLQRLNHRIHEDTITRFVYGLENRMMYGNKHHTCRKGKRFKKGDLVSIRVWGNDINPKSGRGGPYHSKQIIISPDIEVVNVWDIRMGPARYIDECKFFINGKRVHYKKLSQLAANDGLSVVDYLHWFCGGSIKLSNRKPFDGQIICWNSNIKY